MAEAASALEELDAALWGTPGLPLLLARPEVIGELGVGCQRLDAAIHRLEYDLDRGAGDLGSREVGARNAALTDSKTWSGRLSRNRSAGE